MRYFILFLMLAVFNADAMPPAMLSGAGGVWTNVAEPTGWPWALPFTIQQKRRVFRPDPTDGDANPQTRANLAITKTYYVATNGNNASDGLSWATAFRDLVEVKTRGDCDRVYLATNYYAYKDKAFYGGMNRSMEIIGVGTNISITSDFSNILTNGWTLVGSCYTQALSAEFVQQVYDDTNLDTNGRPGALTQVGSQAACSSTANSFYREFPLSIAVHTWDSRAPDLPLRFLEAVALSTAADNLTGYVENVTFKMYPQPENATSAGNTRFYFNNCTFLGGFYALGCNEVYLKDCTLYLQELNYHTKNGIRCNVFEWNVHSSYNIGDATVQASTAHDTNIVVSIGGVYHHSTGQNVADATGAKRWMLGSRVFNSTISGSGIYTESTNWLDCVQSSGNLRDIDNTAGSQTWTRSFVGGATNRILGTLTTY